MRRTAAAAAAVLLAAQVVLALAVPALGSSGDHPPVRLAVVAAVPDLRWTDVASMPTLRSLAAEGASGLLVDKTAGTATGCLTGLLAIAAGTRTSGPEPGGPATCSERRDSRIAADNRHNPYAADVTAFGGALHRAGVDGWVDGADARAILAGAAEVAVGRYPAPAASATPRPDFTVRRAARSGRPAVVAAADPRLLLAPRGGAARATARAEVDRWLAGIRAATPPSALLVVVGSSDAADGAAHLHVAVVSGPGIPHRALTSGSTGRAPFVQLVDVAPTVLRALGIRVPAGMIGAPMAASGSPAPTIADAIDADRHAVAAVPAGEALRSLVITLASLAVILLLLTARWPGLRRPATLLARIALPMPLLSWLAQLVPWWRAGAAWVVTGLVVLSLVVALLLTVLRRAGLPAGVELLALPAATGILLVADQLAGGGLQISAPLGDDPLEAGRFTGIGNAAFAILLGTAILVAAVWAGRLMARAGRRSTGLTVSVVVLLAAVVVDGAPQWGDDLGGLLAAVPAAAVTLLLLAGWRLSRRRAAAIAGGAVVLAAAAALADYARPASEQTHLGHFVGQVLHGGSGTTLHRKLVGTLQLQGELPLVAALVALALPRRTWDRPRAWLRRTPGLTAAVAGLLVLAVLGALLNDSGVAVLGFVVVAAAPAIVAGTAPPQDTAAPSDPPA